MAYEKQTWNDGDIITAEKLNHIEDGIDSAGVDIKKIEIISSTLSISHSSLVGGVSYVSGTGGKLKDDKTFGELINNKNIIDYQIEAWQENGDTIHAVLTGLFINGIFMPVGVPDDELSDTQYFGMNIIHDYNPEDGENASCPFKVYAICV